MGTLPDFKHLPLPYPSQSFAIDRNIFINFIVIFQIFEPHSLSRTICALNAKRLGEGGTQTFDDGKYITGNPHLQGL
jgi:hypothetical protein